MPNELAPDSQSHSTDLSLSLPALVTQSLSYVAETRFCNKCQTHKPLRQFRREHSGEERRKKICHDCQLVYDRGRRLRKKNMADERKVTLFFKKIAAAKTSRQIEIIVETLDSQLGGTLGIVETLKRHLVKAEKKGGMRLVRAMIAFLELTAYVENQQTQPADMTDEELWEARESSVCDLMVLRGI